MNINEVKSIKTKLANKYDELEVYNRDLTYLFSKKESAYSSKDYSSVNRIKSEIEGVKSRKEDIDELLSYYQRKICNLDKFDTNHIYIVSNLQTIADKYHIHKSCDKMIDLLCL